MKIKQQKMRFSCSFSEKKGRDKRKEINEQRKYSKKKNNDFLIIVTQINNLMVLLWIGLGTLWIENRFQSCLQYFKTKWWINLNVIIFHINSIVLTLISLQPDGVNLRYFKLRLFGRTELKTLEWWISGLRLNPLFFLISRLNIACLHRDFNLQIKFPTGYLDISF